MKYPPVEECAYIMEIVLERNVGKHVNFVSKEVEKSLAIRFNTMPGILLMIDKHISDGTIT